MILRYSCSDFATSHFGQFAGSSIYRAKPCSSISQDSRQKLVATTLKLQEANLGLLDGTRRQKVLVAVLVVGFFMDFWGHSWFSYLFWGAEYGLLSIAYCSLVWLRAFDDQLTDISCDLLKTQALSALLGTVPQLQSEGRQG